MTATTATAPHLRRDAFLAFEGIRSSLILFTVAIVLAPALIVVPPGGKDGLSLASAASPNGFGRLTAGFVLRSATGESVAVG
jgi:hypothetical protein